MTDTDPRRPTLDEIHAARERLAPHLARTPLIHLDLGLPDRKIFLKLETLSPIGAFKIRPALNAVLTRDAADLRNGVATVSSGNMAYGLAWAARHAGIPMAAYMYADAPKAKIEGVQKLGGQVRFISHEAWWQYITDAERPDLTELLINPVTDQAVLTGNGTIGMEIVEDLPEVDCVLTPYGGGSLTSGVASAVKALRPEAKVFAVEGEHAAPVTAALAAGRIVGVETTPAFIKSIGGPSLLPKMWPLVRDLIDGTAVVTLAQVVEAMRLLFASAKVVAEGAGAAALAAAMSNPHATGNVVCIVSGGNIDAEDYMQVLRGEIPSA
ncbi:pyridoxal-phosphate dependent enzyme [Mesorhizobium sp. KR1-2]|uniref:pyridoxal-phosphate dependent enzyme n=1 Tax=Mesorhizobium sp. KR1-2 TaxID=3156609 RepID=UPI0032B59B07